MRIRCHALYEKCVPGVCRGTLGCLHISSSEEPEDGGDEAVRRTCLFRRTLPLLLKRLAALFLRGLRRNQHQLTVRSA